jgi:hypothetical protein
LADRQLLAVALGGEHINRRRRFFFGTRDLIQMARAGGLWHRLAASFGFGEILIILRRVLVIAGSFAWAGIWSLAFLPRILLLPVVLLAASALRQPSSTYLSPASAGFLLFDRLPVASWIC